MAAWVEGRLRRDAARRAARSTRSSPPPRPRPRRRGGGLPRAVVPVAEHEAGEGHHRRSIRAGCSKCSRPIPARTAISRRSRAAPATASSSGRESERGAALPRAARAVTGADGPGALRAVRRACSAGPGRCGAPRILVATVNVFLFAFDRPWTASDGLRNWGDWVLTGLGLVQRPDLIAPWLYSGSLLNLGVLLGGLAARAAQPRVRDPRAAARRAGQGRRRGPADGRGRDARLRLQHRRLLLGDERAEPLGLRHDAGPRPRRLPRAALSALGAGAPSGAGRAGAARVYGAPAADGPEPPAAGRRVVRGDRAAGRCRSSTRAAATHAQGVFLLFGVVFGVVFQRSRFCLVRAFREPFMTGDAEHTRAAALALVGQHARLRDPEVHRPQGQGRLGVPGRRRRRAGRAARSSASA